MKVHIVTYNMAMGGPSRDPQRLPSKQVALDMFCNGFASLVGTSTDPWVLCVQEINRNEGGVNQAEVLRDRLKAATGRNWVFYSNDIEGNDKGESVAIFTAQNVIQVDRFELGNHRVAVAARVEMAREQSAWVVNAHPSPASSDQDGSKRSGEVQAALKRVVGYGSQLPVILAGDFQTADTAPGTSSTPVDRHAYEMVVQRIARLGFTRGSDFVPGRGDVTYPSWDGKPYYLYDYLFVNPVGRCTPEMPSVVNFSQTQGANTYYASDHKGVLLPINFPNSATA